MALAVSGASGCIEWLEVAEPAPEIGGGAAADALPTVAPAAPPTSGPRLDGKGPLVPRTPGLRVSGGYWTRVRLDLADLWLPFTWLVADAAPVEDIGRAPHLNLRLLASSHRSGGAEVGVPTLRAVIPLAVPAGTALDAVQGLVFGPEAMEGSSISLRTTREMTWLVTPERLLLEEVGPLLVRGALEGTARRGRESTRVRRFRAGFLALRAPSGRALVD